MRLALGRLLEEVEEGGEAEDAAGGAEDGLVGDLSLKEVGCGLGGIDADEGVFLSAEIELVLVEEAFAEIDLVEGVSIEDALSADVAEGILHLGDGGGDIGAGLESGVEILERAEDAAGGIEEELIAGNVGADGIAIREFDGSGVAVAVVGDGAGSLRERLGGDGGTGKEKSALIGGVGEAEDLRDEALHFAGDGLAIAGVEGAVGAFRAEGDGASESRDDIAHGGISDLKFRLEGADVLQELIILAGLVVIADESGDGGGIIGELVDGAAGGELLGGGVLILLALRDGSEQIRQEVGIETNGH